MSNANTGGAAKRGQLIRVKSVIVKAPFDCRKFATPDSAVQLRLRARVSGPRSVPLVDLLLVGP